MIIFIIIVIVVRVAHVRCRSLVSVAILHQVIAVHLVLRAAACRYRGFSIWI